MQELRLTRDPEGHLYSNAGTLTVNMASKRLARRGSTFWGLQGTRRITVLTALNINVLYIQIGASRLHRPHNPGKSNP